MPKLFNMTEQFFTIQFEDVSDADATKYAKELQLELQSAIPDLNVTKGHKEKNNQDLGATLIIGILSAPAVVKLVEKLGDWMPKRNAKITVIGRNGQVIAENLKSRDAAMLADKMIEKLDAKS